MNLFDMIFRNALPKEVVFSSVYNYLLEKSETHGMGSLIFEKILDSIPDQELIQRVRQDYTEWNEVETEYDLGPKVGRVDSLLSLDAASGDRKLWLLTEVKIVDASARNTKDGVSQLVRYAKAAIKEKNVEFILLYLIPSWGSSRAIEEFTKLLEKIDEEHRKRCFLLFWKSNDGTTEANRGEVENIKEHVLKRSFEEILQEVLSDEGSGKIAPISTEIRYVLKSIIHTIRQDFNRPIDVYEQGRFPDRRVFLENIPETHGELFEYLEELFGRRRGVSPAHTSVGFPYPDESNYISNKSLFRVLTMVKYPKKASDSVEDSVAHRLILECDESIYSQEIWNKISRMSSSFAEVKQGMRHPDAVGKSPTVWIEVNRDLGEDEVEAAKKWLEQLVETLRDGYKEWLRSQN